MMTNDKQWMNNDSLEKNWWNFFKKSDNNISKKKIFSWEIRLLTWNVINMLENPPTEYQYNWYFYSYEIFTISVFYFHKQMEFSVLKRVLFINKPTYRNSVLVCPEYSSLSPRMINTRVEWTFAQHVINTLHNLLFKQHRRQTGVAYWSRVDCKVLRYTFAEHV